jgi:hypothetical protein
MYILIKVNCVSLLHLGGNFANIMYSTTMFIPCVCGVRMRTPNLSGASRVNLSMFGKMSCRCTATVGIYRSVQFVTQLMNAYGKGNG